MADLQIKKGALQGSLTREWRAESGRPAIERVPLGKEKELVPLLDNVLRECSRHNIQKCKDFIISYVLPAEDRVKALSAYLEAVFKSLSQTSKASEDSSMQRLFLLWLLNDIFYHLKHLRTAGHGTAPFYRFAAGIDLVKLFTHAAQCGRTNTEERAVYDRLRDLLQVWELQQYFTDEFLEDLGRILDNTGESVELITHDAAERIAGADAEEEEGGPYGLSGHYGEAGGDWFTQPAGVMLQQLSLSSGRPIRTGTMKPIQTTRGRVTDEMITAVQDFVAETRRDRFADVDEDYVHGIDDLGQLILKNASTGELSYGETYYGFSRNFMETLKATEQWMGLQQDNEDESLDDIITNRGGGVNTPDAGKPNWKRLYFWEAPEPPRLRRSPSPRRSSPIRRRSLSPQQHSLSPPPRARDRQPRSPSPSSYSRPYDEPIAQNNSQRDSRDHYPRPGVAPIPPPPIVQSRSPWPGQAQQNQAPPPPMPWLGVGHSIPPPPPGYPANMPWPPPPPPPPGSAPNAFPLIPPPPQFQGIPPPPPSTFANGTSQWPPYPPNNNGGYNNNSASNTRGGYSSSAAYGSNQGHYNGQVRRY